MFFRYGSVETEYLKAKDKRLGEVIERLGHLERTVDEDLFTSVVHSIVAQQISSKALDTVWGRMLERFGSIDAERLASAEREEIQALGMSFRKAEYIRDFAEKVHSGVFDPESVREMSDEEAVRALSALKGIGVWTAEMLLLFCLQRPDILSYDDLGIRRGLRMVYRHRTVDRKLFEKYRRRYSPYGSVASLYLWAVAGGAVPDLKDCAPAGASKGKGSRSRSR